jgi:GNAT superfamily N-acetyltransferase
MATHTYTRPWVEGDLRRLHRAEPSFSAETLSSRFLTGNSRLPPAYLATLRHPRSAGRAWLGQVAFADGDLVGLAECAWSPGSAQPGELAVLVADRWQRRGVGRRLVNDLVKRCEAAGLTHLEAMSDAANSGSYALVRSIASGRHRPGGWSVRSWTTGGQRYFELIRGEREAVAGRLRLPTAA